MGRPDFPNESVACACLPLYELAAVGARSSLPTSGRRVPIPPAEVL
jgi:hypothetical protein